MTSNPLFVSQPLRTLCASSTKIFLLCIGIFFCSLQMVWAGSLLTFSKQGFAEDGFYGMTLNSVEAFSLQQGQAVDLDLPNNISYKVILDKIENHANGDKSWVGHLQDLSDTYRVFITREKNGNGLYGQVLTPKGLYLINSSKDTYTKIDQAELTDVQRSGLSMKLFGNDVLLDKDAPPISVPNQNLHEISKANNFADTGTGNTVIDVMILYTPELTAQYGPISSIVNNLIILSNQAYIDSNIGITLRVVAIQQVAYTSVNDNSVALTDLAKAASPAFTNIPALRNKYGADLVSLIRPYSSNSTTSCGLAYLSGGGANAINPTGATGFSAVSYGNDKLTHFYCVPYTFTHELGHNMGAAHDAAHAGGVSGAFPYSFGYGQDGKFGTIMSYINPQVGKFSSPNLNCYLTMPCGVADVADNALTLNKTAKTIAAFRATAVGTSSAATANNTDADRVFNWIQDLYYTYAYPTVSTSQTAGGLYYRYYPGTHSYVGTYQGNLYYLDVQNRLVNLGSVNNYLNPAILLEY